MRCSIPPLETSVGRTYTIIMLFYNSRVVFRAQNDDSGSDKRNDPLIGLMLKARPKTKKPSLYKVLLLNDDFTPMDFVVLVLERFFNKDTQQATEIMMSVHRTGVGLCGIYTYEIAETKVAQVLTFSREHQHPLQCTMEKD